jgi:hypothetical protein
MVGVVTGMPTEDKTSEHLLKLAALNEFETALNYKTSYETLAEGMLGVLQEFLHYCDKNGVEVPERESYYRIVSRAQDLMTLELTSTGILQRRNWRNPPETGQNRNSNRFYTIT